MTCIDPPVEEDLLMTGLRINGYIQVCNKVYINGGGAAAIIDVEVHDVIVRQCGSQLSPQPGQAMDGPIPISRSPCKFATDARRLRIFATYLPVHVQQGSSSS